MKKPYTGPFTVTKVFHTTDGCPHAYELRLPTSWRCHPVFKARYLEPYHDGQYLFPGRTQTPPPVPQLESNGQIYHHVERILADRVVQVRRGNRTAVEKQWLTRFKGEGPVGDLWLPIENLQDDLGECEEWLRYEKAKQDAHKYALQRHPAAPLWISSLTHVESRLQEYLKRRERAINSLACIQEYLTEHQHSHTLQEVNKIDGTWQAVGRTLAHRPSKIRALVLFCGTGSVERELHAMFEHAEIITVDSNIKWSPTHCVDILKWSDLRYTGNFSQYPVGYFDIIWASPPCEEYSQANTTGNRDLALADARVQATRKIINSLRPTYWFLENPQSYDPVGLRWRKAMVDLEDFRHACCYCKYGAAYKKPTNIWTNVPNLRLQMCNKDQGYCLYRADHGHHEKTAQAGPTARQAGSGGGEKVYAIPTKLLRTLFAAMQFTKAIASRTRDTAAA
jgi:hypothetical protein